jgi:hypothetical protein
MLTFDEARHEYRWNGVVVPSVTQCLDRLHSFAGVPFEVLEAAKERGTYVHAMCELFDMGDLDEPLVPKEYLGYLDAWKRFIDDYEPNWSGIEVRGYSQRFAFAGTEDRHGTLAKKLPGRWGIDIKTSKQPHRVWGLQTAAYRQIRAERDMQAALDRRGTVQLQSTGTYRFLPWDDPADWPVFQALLTVINWSKQ